VAEYSLLRYYKNRRQKNTRRMAGIFRAVSDVIRLRSQRFEGY